jgi:OPT family oligopeptide transporter
MEKKSHQPYIEPGQFIPEFTLKAITLGSIFGILFGVSTTYLALKAGLTVSASIPISVIAISLGRKLFKTTILENNIIQTTGSAGESIASGVVFTLPAFLFLSPESNGAQYFNYWTILTLAIIGGLLGTLLMVPLRRSLIVNEHDTLPYPEGTACSKVLIAGEKGGDLARTAFWGMGIAALYAVMQKIFTVISPEPTFKTSQENSYMPAVNIGGEITPEYLGVGYIIGARICGVLVAGGVLAWLGLIPLLETLVPTTTIAQKLVDLKYLEGMSVTGGKGGWNPLTAKFDDPALAIYYAYIRQIGAGAVTAGGFITLFKSLPTIIKSFKESVGALREGASAAKPARTEDDLSMKAVMFGVLALIVLMVVLPQIPGGTIIGKFGVALLVILFGFFFVTVSSRIVGIIGTTNNPISGMTIATIMGTGLVFITFGLKGFSYEPIVLLVGGLICIAAANAGATSQDLKTGYLVGATPRYQQLALFIGVIVSSLVIGFTVRYLDTPTALQLSQGVEHAIGTTYAAPQPVLMATLIRGLLGSGLDWQFIMVGVFIAITLELCGIKSLSFAVGLYLPLSTTLPIFIGGAIKAAVDWYLARQGRKEDEDLGKGSLFATGLVAGGSLIGCIIALFMVNESVGKWIENNGFGTGLVNSLGQNGYDLLGALFFIALAIILFRVATSEKQVE